MMPTRARHLSFPDWSQKQSGERQYMVDGGNQQSLTLQLRTYSERLGRFRHNGEIPILRSAAETYETLEGRHENLSGSNLA
jgi:hypothetical protein